MSTDYSRYIARPWTFKFEMSRGCNLRCKFCAVFAKPELYSDPEKRRFMPADRMRKIARSCNELNPTARVELAARGEPTLNPEILENIRAIREEMPKAQISVFTNGVVFLKENPALGRKMLNAGVNILNIDCYNNTYDRFQEWAKKTIADSKKETELKDFRTFSAYAKHNKGHAIRVINLVPDIAASVEGKPLVAVRVLHNMAGNADPEEHEKRFGIKPLTEPLEKNCARPYREFQVQYDGRVVICCLDWASESVMGKMPEQSAAEIWYSKLHRAILRDLYRKDRSGAPCNKCNYRGGYRLGLLQNPFKAKEVRV